MVEYQWKVTAQPIYLNLREILDMTLKIPDCTDRDKETRETDPLFALAGTLQCNVTDIEDRIKDACDALQAEIRVVEGAHKDDPDPLIALLGTLECDVTDIGERHDDYIAAALLAELNGNNEVT